MIKHFHAVQKDLVPLKSALAFMGQDWKAEQMRREDTGEVALRVSWSFAYWRRRVLVMENPFSGVEAVQEVRLEDPRLVTVQVVILTISQLAMDRFRGGAEDLLRHERRRLQDIRRLKPGLRLYTEDGTPGELTRVELRPALRSGSVGLGGAWEVVELEWRTGYWADLGTLDELAFP